jgi:hypothetical protein
VGTRRREVVTALGGTSPQFGAKVFTLFACFETLSPRFKLMASVCAPLALMDAGVPHDQAGSGIAMESHQEATITSY